MFIDEFFWAVEDVLFHILVELLAMVFFYLSLTLVFSLTF